MELEKDVTYEPVLQLKDGVVTFVLKDQFDRVYADVTKQVAQALKPE